MELNLKKEEKNIGGVYRIRNLLNQRLYIGSTNNFSKRFSEHSRALKNNKHGKFLQHDFNQSGSENFIFEILEVVENNKSQRLLRE